MHKKGATQRTYDCALSFSSADIFAQCKSHPLLLFSIIMCVCICVCVCVCVCVYKTCMSGCVCVCVYACAHV